VRSISTRLAQDLKKGSWIRRLFDEGRRLKEIHGADAVFDFSLGNPIVEPPKAFRDALEQVVAETTPGNHRYIENQGLRSTRQKVAEYLNGRLGTDIRPETTVMTVGAAGALNVALRALLDAGDEVVLLTPYFVEYDYYVTNSGGKVVHCPLAEDFTIDLDALARALSARTRAVIVNTPHNPTGTVLTQANLDAFGQLLKDAEARYGGAIYLLYDDPYSQLVYDCVPPNPFTSYPRTLLASSFSKDLGIAGERLGYIGVDSRMEDAELVTSALVFCNRSLGFVNAPLLVQRVIARMSALTVEQSGYRSRRDRMVAILQEAGYDFRVPQGGFFIFPKSPIGDDVEFCMTAARDFRVLLVPGTGFGRAGHFRLSYSVPLEQIERSREPFQKLRERYL
jgi:aspartate aminotransferase